MNILIRSYKKLSTIISITKNQGCKYSKLGNHEKCNRDIDVVLIKQMVVTLIRYKLPQELAIRYCPYEKHVHGILCTYVAIQNVLTSKK